MKRTHQWCTKSRSLVKLFKNFLIHKELQYSITKTSNNQIHQKTSDGGLLYRVRNFAEIIAKFTNFALFGRERNDSNRNWHISLVFVFCCMHAILYLYFLFKVPCELLFLQEYTQPCYLLRLKWHKKWHVKMSKKSFGGWKKNPNVKLCSYLKG